MECHEFSIYVDLPSLSLCTIKFYNLFVGQPLKAIILSEELARKMGGKSLEILERMYNIDQAVSGFVSAIEYVRGLKGKVKKCE